MYLCRWWKVKAITVTLSWLIYFVYGFSNYES